MISGLLKLVAFAATTAVAIPYTSALLCNVAFGWPQVKNRFRRALNPRKVYALNYVILQNIMTNVRYLRLYLQWTSFYKMASAAQVMKDRPYGRNDQLLDLYFPDGAGQGEGRKYPVVVFVFGGAWGSGSKCMYGMMCSLLANKLKVIVCCPNHSTYPQGYVDDMVQDIVDCLSWIYTNVEDYGGDKKKIILIGHSAGAHLCAMSMLELLHDEVVTHSQSDYQPCTTSTIQFSEQHFNGSNGEEAEVEPNDGCQSSGSSGSFIVVDTKTDNGKQSNGQGGKELATSLTAEQGVELQSQHSVLSDVSDASMMESDLKALSEAIGEGLRYRGKGAGSGEESEIEVPEGTGERGLSVGSTGTESVEEESGDNESVVTVKSKADVEPELADIFPDTQPSLRELSKSVKAFVGLAGVYHIADHFKHESKRGVEDLSTMTRSMYGEQHFDRFSPTHILSMLNGPISFPPVVLVHGTEDYVVPLSSTNKFSEQLQRLGTNVKTHVIPGCDHYAICLDLMREDRKYHRPVLALIENLAERVFS